MGKHGEGGNITGGINAGNGSLHTGIDHYAPFNGNSYVFKAYSTDVCAAANGVKNLVSLGPAGFSFRGLLDNFISLHGNHLAAKMELHTFLCVLGLEHC